MSDGSRHDVYIIPEVSYGVVPTTPVFDTLRITGITLGLNKDSLLSNELRGDRQLNEVVHGARGISGNINFNLSYTTFDKLLEAVLGGTWVTDTPIVGTDQLKAGVTRRSFTVERLFNDIQSADKPYHRYTGVEINSLQIQANTNAAVACVADVIGSDTVLDTVIVPGATYTPMTTTPIMQSFSGTVNEGGSVIAIITELSLTVDNGMEARLVVGSNVSLQPSIGYSNVTGQVTAYFENSALYEKFVDEVESSLDFSFIDANGNTLKFTVPRIKYTGGDIPVAGPGPVLVTLPFQAVLDTSAASNLVIERTPV